MVFARKSAPNINASVSDSSISTDNPLGASNQTKEGGFVFAKKSSPSVFSSSESLQSTSKVPDSSISSYNSDINSKKRDISSSSPGFEDEFKDYILEKLRYYKNRNLQEFTEASSSFSMESESGFVLGKTTEKVSEQNCIIDPSLEDKLYKTGTRQKKDQGEIDTGVDIGNVNDDGSDTLLENKTLSRFEINDGDDTSIRPVIIHTEDAVKLMNLNQWNVLRASMYSGT